MTGFPEGTVIIRDVRDGLVRQLVVRPDGWQHVGYFTRDELDQMRAAARVFTLELQRRMLEKATNGNGPRP